MSGELMDQAIQAMVGKQWALATLDAPTSGMMDCPEPIAAADLHGHADVPWRGSATNFNGSCMCIPTLSTSLLEDIRRHKL